MAIPILKNWQQYFLNPDEGLGSSYERIVINNKLLEICKKYNVNNLLESPSFGFTGVSGINSFAAAKKNIKTTLVDHNQQRINLIAKFWSMHNASCQIHFTKTYSDLPFDDNQFDLSWNFSAMWFTKNLNASLSELCRVSKKAVFICVPNRSGLGYVFQKISGKKELKKYLKEENIIPKNIIREMNILGWKLIENDYIDCPWWPDIGMPKAKFLKYFGLDWLIKEKNNSPITIMDYYDGKDTNFASKMMKHYWFEKNAPNFIKKFWSHHKYFLFEPK